MSNPLQVKEHRDYDPRIGDEDVSTPQSDLADNAQSSPIPHSARPSPELESNDYCGKGKGSATRANLSQRATTSRVKLPDSLRWIPDNWTLSKWMPAIRCAVAEWTSLVLLVVKPTTQAMGQAGFLVLVGRWTLHTSSEVFVEFSLSAGMLSPPGDPFVTNIEREIIILLSVLVAWGLVRGLLRIHTPPCATLYADGQA